MSLNTLISKYIQTHQGKHFVYERMIRDLLTEISITYTIPTDDLLTTCEQFLNRSSHVEICQGFVVSKNNTHCTCPAVENENYCKRHLYLKENKATSETICIGTLHNNASCTAKAVVGQYCKRHVRQSLSNDTTHEKTRCAGETRDGSQCVRDAQPGHTLCGTHIKKIHNESLRKSERKPCAFYNQTNTELTFCENNARKGLWLCKNHQHLQPMYASMYKKRNLDEYIEDASAFNSMVETLLKEYDIKR